jgi:hypothetical protein
LQGQTFRTSNRSGQGFGSIVMSVLSLDEHILWREILIRKTIIKLPFSWVLYLPELCLLFAGNDEVRREEEVTVKEKDVLLKDVELGHSQGEAQLTLTPTLGDSPS